MIEVRHLSKSFGSLRVLEDISLHIRAGEIYGIIGQSGAGKSTLLRCLNGLEPYQAGSVRVNGQEIRELGTAQLRGMQKQMGMIFQGFNLLSRANVYDNVALPLQFSGINPKSKASRERILQMIDLVGLSDKVASKPRELSGGQKQRVCIARALVLQPKILLCDEATSALDPKITQEILSLLLKIRQELNLTLVVVTHQMEVVKRICERVAFLKDGRLVQEGRPEDLFVMPNQDIRRFLGDTTEVLPREGRNIQLFFSDDAHKSYVITSLARALDIDFSICWANLENFRESVLGSLIINVREADYEHVVSYLRKQNIVTQEVL
ncbi:MAG: methionine ABC transporter ATP-binding protein [Clostridia bacterium]|nr:methionine ABC transporter ATP-binding protein [Clostridia bacterium]